MARGSLGRRLILNFGRKSRRVFNRAMVGSSRLGDPPVFPASVFPWTATLEANVPVIRRELEAVMAEADALPGVEEISPDHSRIARERRWRSFFLHAYGYRSAPACELCPRTAALVDAIPHLETAFFSVLRPGAHLPRHRGVTKALITCHLPLIVPEDNADCWIEVDGERHHWHHGRTFVFDDTRIHEVRNDTRESRVVLLIHVRRPLAFPGSLAGNLFMGAVKRSPFVRDGVRNQQAFEQSFVIPRLASQSRRVDADSFLGPVVPLVDVGDRDGRGYTGERAGADGVAAGASRPDPAHRRDQGRGARKQDDAQG